MTECRNCGSTNLCVENIEDNTSVYQSFGQFVGYEVECFGCGEIVSFNVTTVDIAVRNLYAEDKLAGTVTHEGRDIQL